MKIGEIRFKHLTQEQRQQEGFRMRPSATLFLASLSNEQILALLAILPKPQFPESYLIYQEFTVSLERWRMGTYPPSDNDLKLDRELERMYEEFFVVEGNF